MGNKLQVMGGHPKEQVSGRINSSQGWQVPSASTMCNGPKACCAASRVDDLPTSKEHARLTRQPESFSSCSDSFQFRKGSRCRDKILVRSRAIGASPPRNTTARVSPWPLPSFRGLRRPCRGRLPRVPPKQFLSPAGGTFRHRGLQLRPFSSERGLSLLCRDRGACRSSRSCKRPTA